jgi:hypothetical protein
MKRVKRRDARMKNVLLTVLAAGIVLAVVGSISVAAPAPSAATSSVKSPTVFDPFALRTVVLSSATVQDPPAVGLIKNPNPRRPIRIPARPGCRSGFRPHDDC